MEANKIYWKQGFHETEIEGSVEISLEYWQELIEGQSIGKCITEDKKGYPILTDPEPIENTLSYDDLIEREIRKKYSVSDEIAILRQRDTKPDEFTEYFNFCESVKASLK